MTTLTVVIFKMNILPNLRKNLMEFGLTDYQIDIYILLNQRKDLRIRDIVKELGIPRSSVYESLNGLFGLGLAEEIIENSYKVIRPYPISVIKHSLDERLAELQKQILNVDKLSDQLTNLPIRTNHSTAVRYYKGRAGARQIFWNTLKAKNVLYVYSEWGRSRYVGVKFYQNFVSESFARDFSEQVITNPLPRVINNIKQDNGSPVSRTKIENIRLIDRKKIPFKGDTFMYDNIYAQVYLKDKEISGFEIESQQFVDTQRSIYEMMWEKAKPLSEYL